MAQEAIMHYLPVRVSQPSGPLYLSTGVNM